MKQFLYINLFGTAYKEMLFPILLWVCVFLIIYTYVGYPLIISLVAQAKRTKRATQIQSPYLPNITLLITAYNEEEFIIRKLENSLEIDYPPENMQILVAADGSADRTVEYIQKFTGQGVELNFDSDRRGKLAAIIRAMPKATGEIIIFSDANNLYEPQAIRELVQPFTNSNVGGVTGAKTIIKDGGRLAASEGIYWKYESFIKLQESMVGVCTSTVGEIFAIRRELFIPPPESIINDDFYIASDLIRRGFDLRYAPNARSYETASSSIQNEFIRRTRIISGRYQALSMAVKLLPWRRPLVLWQVISHKYLRLFIPFWMIGILLANIALLTWPNSASLRSDPSAIFLLTPPYNWILLKIQLIFYGLAFLSKKVKMGGLLGVLVYIPAFLVNSNLATLAGFYQYLMGKHTHIWERVERSQMK